MKFQKKALQLNESVAKLKILTLNYYFLPPKFLKKLYKNY